MTDKTLTGLPSKPQQTPVKIGRQKIVNVILKFIYHAI